MPEGPRTARSTTSFSTGGTPSCWITPAAPDRIRMNSRPARSTSGRIASVQTRALGACAATVSCVTARSRCFEESHPPELRELALVRVEHELARVPEAGLENRAFALTEHQRVGRLARGQRGPGPVGVEEHAVEVDAVDQVELGDVDDIHPD